MLECRADWKTLRQHGHRGPCLQVYGFDRCGFTKLRRLFMAFHALIGKSYSTATYDAADLMTMELLVFLPCALHDIHNAFRWSLLAEFNDRELLKNIWIAIASLRQCYLQLIRFLAEWASVSMVFVRAYTPDEADCWKSVWSLFMLLPCCSFFL